MTREEMREKVARALAETQGEIVNDAWRFYLDDADAAIAIIRAETLEEAARVVESTPFQFKITGAPPGSIEVVDTSKTIAAAIRALKNKP